MGLIHLHFAHAADVALDDDDLAIGRPELQGGDQELVKRREQVAPVANDPLIATLDAAADRALRRVYLDLGIEELRGGGPRSPRASAQYPRLVCARVGKWKVTVRHGSSVGREKFDSLDEAIDEAQRRVEEIRLESGLPAISVFRTHAPDQRVHARIEISGPGLIRAPEGGIDVMGDGTVIPYSGAIRKERIGADTLDEAFERLQEALER